MHAGFTPLPLRLVDLGYEVGRKLLIDGITATIGQGPRTIVMGPNGAGKSLTLRLCHGLIAPTRGRIEWSGEPAPGRRAHAMVFQRPVLLRRTVRANLDYALSVSGATNERRAQRVEAALARFGLDALADRPARVLSGGEQQRVAIARAWALDPHVLFLDEPTSALDPGATRQIEQAIGELQADGIKVVMTTHDLGQARRLADEVLFLNRGRLVEQTPADRFFDTPRTEEAKAFLRGDLLW